MQAGWYQLFLLRYLTTILLIGMIARRENGERSKEMPAKFVHNVDDFQGVHEIASLCCFKLFTCPTL